MFKATWLNQLFAHIKPWEVIAYHMKTSTRLARGQFESEWENKLFPPGQPEKA